jgi:hypothetical protein
MLPVICRLFPVICAVVEKIKSSTTAQITGNEI